MNTIRLAPASLFLLVAVVGMALVAGGCESGITTRTYSVSVANQAAVPVTVWLTKDGPVYERAWQSPEDLAKESAGGEVVAGVVVPPGKTASVGPLSGRFAYDSAAILRVYLGQHNFTDLLAISRGSPDRKDYQLNPGNNEFSIIESNGAVLVQRLSNGVPLSMSNNPDAK